MGMMKKWGWDLDWYGDRHAKCCVAKIFGQESWQEENWGSPGGLPPETSPDL